MSDDIYTYVNALLKNGSSTIYYYGSQRWGIVCSLRKAINAGSASMVTAKWNRRLYWSEEPAPDFMKESTFEDCVSISIDLEDSSVNVAFSEGDSYYGKSTGPHDREWIIKVNFNDFEIFVLQIKRELVELAETMRIKEQEAIEIKRRNEIIDKLLSGENE